MAATGFTPVYLYASGTAGHIPLAANLTNTANGSEIALNYADGNLFFKNGSNAVITTPLLQSSGSQSGWLSSTDWTTFNGKAPAVTYTTNYVPFGQGTTSLNQSSSLTFNGVSFSVGTTAVANSNISVSASASNDTNEPELNFYSAVFANLNKPKIKSANGTLALLVESGSTSTFQKRARLRLDGGGAAQATIQTSADNGSTYTDQLTIGATGDVTVSTGNLVIGTSGKGIDFSATPDATATSELLADYEEGTFTATLGGFISDPSTPVTSTAYYTKIGRQVVCTIAFNNVNTTGGAGAILVRGLPFVPSGNASMNAVQMAGMGTAVGISYVGNSTTFSIYDAVNNANIVIVSGTGKYLLTTVTYFV